MRQNKSRRTIRVFDDTRGLTVLFENLDKLSFAGAFQGLGSFGVKYVQGHGAEKSDRAGLLEKVASAKHTISDQTNVGVQSREQESLEVLRAGSKFATSRTALAHVSDISRARPETLVYEPPFRLHHKTRLTAITRPRQTVA